MYRKFDKKSISRVLTIYNYDNDYSNVSLDGIDDFFESPTKSKLVKLLCSDISDDVKKAIMLSLSSAINFTSVKDFLKPKDRALLTNILSNIDISLVYTKDELKGIVKYICDKSQNTGIVSKQQINEVKDFFSQEGIRVKVSEGGSSDIDWGGVGLAKADGIIYLKDEIIVYLRCGTSFGGTQKDRYCVMFNTAKLHPDKKFLFICDGIEALLAWNVCQGYFKDKQYQYNNALWTTVKLLPYIDFDKFCFIE